MNTMIKRLFNTVFIASIALSSVSYAANKATTVDELLEMVRSAKISESKEHRLREKSFKAAKSQQQNLLAKVKSEKNVQERKSETLEKVFANNDLKIKALEEQLKKRLGTLKELFGHLTSAAGDVVSRMDQSIVSAQITGRSEPLEALIKKMSNNTRLPSIEEIELLWFEIHREMAEAGKTVNFNAEYISADGEKVNGQILRIGNFNLMSDGEYLSYSPREGVISALPRQPASKYTSAAAELQSSTNGYVKIGIDPTGPSGGGLLKALIDTPTLVEKWHQGGEIGYIISAIGVVAILLALWRFIVLFGMSSKVNTQLKTSSANDNNPLGRVLLVGEQNANLDAESMELKLHESILKERPKIEIGLSLLKIIAMVAPLGGLLGTVTGMIVVFQQITIFGAGDPKMMAGGISQALVTTVLGLVVAIPTVLMHTWINGYAQRILHILDEQSLGIVADRVEKS
ncbi:MAG: MotA/TolQ/ExbB proton channel family protein [Cycloclasticus sp.]|jgi:biopolymer transport protein ExbB|nr:energy transducer TonB [Cycloclasticus sp.]HIL92891.1 energy transducer TonB [Cycloclasticus sp.]